MQPTRYQHLALAALAVMLASCSAPKPPPPPTVDESTRRPANDGQALDVLRLQTQVRNLELQMGAQAQQRHADKLAANWASSREASAPKGADVAAPAKPQPNQVLVVPYGVGQTAIRLSDAELARLIDTAKAASYVVVRGRTDGATDTPTEARIARERAAGMKSFLVGAGIDASKVRVTHQPTGDHLSDNGSVAGRDMNRRVEVELYATKPVVSLLGTTTTRLQ